MNNERWFRLTERTEEGTDKILSADDAAVIHPSLDGALQEQLSLIPKESTGLSMEQGHPKFSHTSASLTDFWPAAFGWDVVFVGVKLYN